MKGRAILYQDLRVQFPVTTRLPQSLPHFPRGSWQLARQVLLASSLGPRPRDSAS